MLDWFCEIHFVISVDLKNGPFKQKQKTQAKCRMLKVYEMKYNIWDCLCLADSLYAQISC